MRISCFGALCTALILAGCQTTAGPAETRVGLNAEQVVTTNEPAALAREHYARGDYALAERHFREAVERTPGDYKLWLGLAASYDQLRRFDLADRAYDNAIRLTGRTAQILNNRGYSYLLRGDRKRAAIMLQEAKALDPDNPVVINNLTLLQSGNRPGGTVSGNRA